MPGPKKKAAPRKRPAAPPLVPEEAGMPQPEEQRNQQVIVSDRNINAGLRRKLRKARQENEELDEQNTMLEAAFNDAQEALAGLSLEVRILRARCGLKMVGDVEYTEAEIKKAQEYDPTKEPARRTRGRAKQEKPDEPPTTEDAAGGTVTPLRGSRPRKPAKKAAKPARRGRSG